MGSKRNLFIVMMAVGLLYVSTAVAADSQEGKAGIVRGIVTSDTILSGMIAALLPPKGYSVEAILPPGQCPGHYDVKMSDIEKTRKADLVVTFRGMPFMNKTGSGRTQLLVDAEGRNWMAPDSYLHGLGVLADKLSKQFPEDKNEILSRKEETIRIVNAGTNPLEQRIKRAGLSGKAIIASSMQKEPLEWMGFRVVGEYGRPEALSVREVVQLSEIGREKQVTAVVDNLQSGPDAGKGVAETLKVPHVVLTNFPSEKGYLATLGENVDALVAAAAKK